MEEPASQTPAPPQAPLPCLLTRRPQRPAVGNGKVILSTKVPLAGSRGAIPDTAEAAAIGNKNVQCKFFAMGVCNKDAACAFSHDLAKPKGGAAPLVRPEPPAAPPPPSPPSSSPGRQGVTKTFSADASAAIVSGNSSASALSKGSMDHAKGVCEPCAWFWKPQGCANAEICNRCHLCPEGEVKARKKAKKLALRSSAALVEEPSVIVA